MYLRPAFWMRMTFVIALSSQGCTGVDGTSASGSTRGEADVGTPTDVTAAIDASATVPDGDVDVEATPGDTATSPVRDAGGGCGDAIPLHDGDTFRAERTPLSGIGSSACRASDAPQRFYAIDVPAGRRANITVTSAAPAWIAVVRVMRNCDDTMCITDGQSDVPGAPVTLYIDNPGTETLHKIVTVSGLTRDSGSAFDIKAALGPAGGGDCGVTPEICPFTIVRSLNLPSDDVAGSFDLTESHRLSGACISSSASGAEDIYTLRLTEARMVQIRVPPTGGSFGSTGLSIRRLCDDSASSLGCNRDYDIVGDALLRVNLEPGHYYVVVDWNGDLDARRYHLYLTSDPVVANSQCSAAMTLVDGSMLAAQNGASGGQTESYCIGDTDAPMPVLYYRATIPAGQTLTVTATPIGTLHTRTGLAILAACPGTTATCLAPPLGLGGIRTQQYTNADAASRDVIVAVMNEGQFDLSASIH